MYKDLSFLRDSFFKKGPGRFYRSVITDGRALYIDHNRTIYLPMLDVNRTVQEAMHYLMRAELPTGRSVKAFMGRIHYFTSGYLASKLVNPMRHSPSLKEMDKSSRLTGTSRRTRSASSSDASSSCTTASWSSSGRYAPAPPSSRWRWLPLLEADQRTSFALSEQIGRTLGDELYALHDEGRLSAVELKTYCFSQNDPLRYERNGRISESA